MSLPRLVVLGTGFGAFNLVKHIKDDYTVIVVSPRNHFLFTPLLPSTTVGTLEFRSIIEPIRQAKKNVLFYRAGDRYRAFVLFDWIKTQVFGRDISQF